jgi:hypothetical protein
MTNLVGQDDFVLVTETRRTNLCIRTVRPRAKSSRTNSRIAPVLLPHLLARSVTFVRFPNGVHGQKFFQKNTDASAPDWLPTVPLRGGGSRRGADSDEIVRYPAAPRAGGDG